MRNSHKDVLEGLILAEKRGDLDSACYADIPNEVYHDPRCPGISSTQIKSILKRSYLHWELERYSPTVAKEFGTAFHTFVNEPDIFVKSFQIIHGKNSEFLAPGMTALKYSDFELIKKMAMRVFAHPEAATLLVDAQNELSFFSRDQETGVLKKVRLDAFKDDKISDLKTTLDASPDAFARECRKWGYGISAAYYLEVVSEVRKKYLKDFYLIPCEKEEPHEVAIYRVSDKSISEAEEKIRKALRYVQAIREGGANAWKGYTREIQDLNI